MRAVAYYRVSTQRQGTSGLGLDAQRDAVRQYLASRGWPPVAEFTEVESGRKNDRPQLAAALTACQLYRGQLVIAKLDRLTRNAAFLLSLRDAEVEFVACDLPEANRLTVGIMALVAEHEAEMISARTKAALGAAKARGRVLGGFRGYTLNAEDGAKAIAMKRQQAMTRAKQITPVLAELRGMGITSLRAIAAELNKRGISAPRTGAWHANSVARLIRSCVRAWPAEGSGAVDDRRDPS